jgi:hypothetical protein
MKKIRELHIMNPELEAVSEHMLDLGLDALAHAITHANYMSFDNAHWSELSVLQAWHAAEILIKARIAQEHPLLIFEQLPRATQTTEDLLELKHLFERGRTFQYSDLPDRLWATTGLRLPCMQRYQDFGKLRNTIQHFTAPKERDFSQETLEFIFEVIDPFINQCWELFAIDYNEDHEPYLYLIAGLIKRGIPFLVSSDAVEYLEDIDAEWPKDKPEYRTEMERRFKAAQSIGNEE